MVGFVWGYVCQQFIQTVYILGAGVFLACLVSDVYNNHVLIPDLAVFAPQVDSSPGPFPAYFQYSACNIEKLGMGLGMRLSILSHDGVWPMYDSLISMLSC